MLRLQRELNNDHLSKKCSFLCVQTNWVCPSGTQRFCKNDSDASLELLTVTRVLARRQDLAAGGAKNQMEGQKLEGGATSLKHSFRCMQ